MNAMPDSHDLAHVRDARANNAAQPITLYSYGPALGLPEGSHFCMKTEIQLKMAGLAYVKDFTGLPQAPKGKLPYIRDGHEIVPDSSFIRQHIERKYGIDLEAGLDARQRAEGWAIERMLEDHLGWAMGWFRWIPAENFAAGPAHFFDAAPADQQAALRQASLAKVTANMHAHGIGRHSMNEVAQLALRSLDSFAMLLGGRDFLFGDAPGAVDATACGVLAGLIVPDLDSPLRRRALALDNVTAYVQRMMGRFYPPAAVPRGAAALKTEKDAALV
jgi:glutathione S-transferase